MTTYLLKLPFCFLFCFSFFVANAQKHEVALPKKTQINLQSPQGLISDKREKRLAAWHKSPYLNVPLEKATVSDLTLAFKDWRAANPEKWNRKQRQKTDKHLVFLIYMVELSITNQIFKAEPRWIYHNMP